MNAYVVMHWHANATPDREGNYVHIAGRKAGIVDYLLTLLKLNSRVVLKVSESGLVFSESSVFSDRNVNTPLAKITSTIYGWKRPFWEAMFISLGIITILVPASVTLAMTFAKEGGVLGLLTAFLPLAVFVGSAIVGVVYYRLNRVLTLGVVTECGETYWLKLKRSLIENVKLDQPLAEAASKVIDTLVMARCAGTQAATSASPAAVVQARPATSVPSSTAPTPVAHTSAPVPASPIRKATQRVNPYVASAPAPAPVVSSGPRVTCIYCATRIAFPPEGAGQEVPCPTCGKPLLLVAS